jgi:hypothetical protein
MENAGALRQTGKPSKSFAITRGVREAFSPYATPEMALVIGRCILCALSCSILPARPDIVLDKGFPPRRLLSRRPRLAQNHELLNRRLLRNSNEHELRISRAMKR